MLISVLTICFNSSATIRDAIKSVNDQVYPYLEHIFIDGYSSDETLSIINVECKRQKNVISERDSGIYQALNKGVKLCRGDYIIVLNSDDVFFSKYVLYDMVNSLIFHGLPDVMSGSVVHVSKLDSFDDAVVYKSVGYRKSFLRLGFIPAHNGTFVRRAVFKDYSYDDSFKSAGDFEWFVRVLSDKKIRFLTTPLIISQQMRGGMSSAGLKSYWRSSKEQKRALCMNAKNMPFLFLLLRLPIKFFWRKLQRAVIHEQLVKDSERK